MNPKLTPDRLRRRAVVYVRQSSPGQVIHHQESQRRQYGLVDRARELGFQDVVAIDDDLGRTASGLVERPGFQRLVGAVCTGEVGAVFCIEASRLARNGRDWHHLIELCGMVGAVLVDFDGVYDPNLVNDRLLLGMKGTMSEFELNLLRQRSREAILQKAQPRRTAVSPARRFLLERQWQDRKGSRSARAASDSVGLWQAGGVGKCSPDAALVSPTERLHTCVASGSGRTSDRLEVARLSPGLGDSHQSSLRGRLRFRQKGSTHQHRGRSGQEEQRAFKTAIHVDRLDSETTIPGTLAGSSMNAIKPCWQPMPT